MILDVFYPNVLKSVDFSFFFYESIRVHKKLGGEARNSKNGSSKHQVTPE